MGESTTTIDVGINLPSPQLTADQLSRDWLELGFPSRDAADLIAKLISTATTVGDRKDIFAELSRIHVEQDGFVEVTVSQESSGEAIVKAKPPMIPSLAVSLLEKNGTLQPDFPLNSRQAVPVETDLFIGRMLMIVRPIRPEDDPYWNDKIFSKRKRRVAFQLQGKFKRAPTGTVYAGGEISHQMRLGLVAKGICGILLKLVKSFSPDTHYSFGDNGDKERPHIVVPAWSFFERLVVTKHGEEPPELGKEFFESEESVAARKNSKSKAQWNTSDTYSMSFFSMYIDLVKWQVVQVPVTSDIDLKTFWGNSSLRIVLYENTTSVKDGRHLQKDNTYFFAIELKHLGLETKNQDEEQEEETPLPWEKTRSMPLSRILGDTGRQESGIMLADLDSEDEFFFDAAEEDAFQETEAERSAVAELSQSLKSVDLLMTIDSVCPAMIEVCHKGKYQKVYAFNLTKTGVSVFRTAASVEEFYATSRFKQTADETWSPRLSSSERYRRVLGHTISQALLDETSGGSSVLKRFAELQTGFDDFLCRVQPSWAAKRRGKIRRSAYCARALSEHHWLEEWIEITDHYIFFHHPDKQKVHLRTSLQSIIEVRCLPSDDTPLMPSFSFIAIGTLGRTIYLMFPSKVDCTDWVDLIKGLIAMRLASEQRSSPDSQSTCSDHSMAFDNPADEFLQESSLWNYKQRRILNGRKYRFHCQSAQINDPASLVEDALIRSFEQNGSDFDEGSMVGFLDSAAALKNVDVNHLDEMERLAFFLNLYHLMIMHAFLVLGPPDSTFKSISYFNTIAYQCSDDIFSLTELEHCIIRAAMNYPSQFVSKFVLPKSRFRFALSQQDYRINFALNCGSESNPRLVPIYRVTSLDTQLDRAARCYLEYTAEVRACSKRGGGVTLTLTLPKSCQWFAADFGNGSTNDVVRCIERFLEDDKRKLVAACFLEQEERYNFNDLIVKYSSFSFECRNLQLDRDW